MNRRPPLRSPLPSPSSLIAKKNPKIQGEPNVSNSFCSRCGRLRGRITWRLLWLSLKIESLRIGWWRNIDCCLRPNRGYCRSSRFIRDSRNRGLFSFWDFGRRRWCYCGLESSGSRQRTLSNMQPLWEAPVRSLAYAIHKTQVS